jgi:hypothetical protein
VCVVLTFPTAAVAITRAQADCGQVSSRDGGTNNFYSVTLATPASTVVQGNLQTSPAPGPGMGGTLFARLPSNVAVPDEIARMTGPP